MTYPEKLLDPRWQKKRLLVLERDEFTCQSCGDTKSTLHVHHIKYSKTPWSVKATSLITYCDFCHKMIELLIKRFPFYKIFFVVKKPLANGGFYPILFYCYHPEDGYLTVLLKLTGSGLSKEYTPISEATINISAKHMNLIKKIK